MPDDGATRASAPILVAAQMRELEAQVRTCPLCRLAKTRTNAVPGEGDYGAEVMLIGEGPGYHEDRQGRPFVGNAGQFLNELLGLAGLSRHDVYITNVVKCRPPNNRDPNPDEIAACAPYLDRQIALINPRIIVTLGRYSMSRFFPGERISQIHGMARMVEGRLCVAMYHPAAGLHQASLADVIRSDFRKLPLFIEQARKLLAPAPSPQAAQVAQAAPAQPATEPAAVPPPPPAAATIQEPVIEYQAAPQTSSPTQPQPTAEPEAQPTIPTMPPTSPARKRIPKPKQKEEYTQLSFLD
jgi:uracil-DNA glycosylase